MNPYDFVRIDWDNPGTRRPAFGHARFQGLSGRLQATVTTLTPFIVLGKQRGDLQTHIRDQDGRGRHIVPGASLKGLFRNLVETVGGGGWWFFGRNGTWLDKEVDSRQVNYSAKLPAAFKRPTDFDELDAACRMFGFLDGKKILAGSVGFEDAVCEESVKHEAIYTCILSSPKPRHDSWYLDDTKEKVRGRKFYFHSSQLHTARGWLPERALGAQRQNAYIQPLGAGSVFTFQLRFSNVAPDDFALLLYAIVLEPSMRHKMGYAKPAGLGSVEIEVSGLEMIDYQARYRAGGGGGTRYEGEALNTFIADTIRPYATDTTSPTLQDLRRIWQWPAVHQQRYPSQDWFKNNRTEPISKTP